MSSLVVTCNLRISKSAVFCSVPKSADCEVLLYLNLEFHSQHYFLLFVIVSGLHSTNETFFCPVSLPQRKPINGVHKHICYCRYCNQEKSYLPTFMHWFSYNVVYICRPSQGSSRMDFSLSFKGF